MHKKPPLHSEIQLEIRRAVSAGDFAKALPLWESYAAEVEREIRAGTWPTDGLEKVRDLIDWTRCLAICAHAHGERRLNTRRHELYAAAAYRRTTR